MMNRMNENMTMNLARALAEDAGMPELRNPRISGMRSCGWIRRLLAKLHG